VTEPRIDAVSHAAPSRGGRRILLVMLPGYGMARDDFARHGFIEAIDARGWPVDVVAAQPDVGLYLDGTVAERLHAEVVRPARREAARLWFLGISLGAMGALLYARRYPGEVAGAILLAPFLGSPGIVAEVAGAGGLAAWNPGDIRLADLERQLLAWLKSQRPAAPDAATLYLGYGRGDRFARGAALLAQQLPERRTIVTDGGHDWETWSGLWRQTLDRDPFTWAGPP
jgi:pimeloyl-ACP methyl ester carboxylesterase